MAAHVDILEQRDSLKRPLVFSAAAHAALFASIALHTSLGNRARILWGDPHAMGGGGAVGITAVRQIPLPSRAGLANPLANDTESRVPQPPKPEAKPAQKPPEPDAIAIRGRSKGRETARPKPQATQSYRAAPDRPNQVYSGVGQALSSQMFGAQTGTGGLRVGIGGTFGQMFGGYVDAMKAKIGQNWRESEVTPRQHRVPAIISFEILRDGSIGSVRLAQTSGNYALDTSAQRAILNSRPFQPLPPGYAGGSVQIEVWFELEK